MGIARSMGDDHFGQPWPTKSQLRSLIESGTGGIFIVSGPSGVGKDFVLSHWLKTQPNLQKVVAWTTRAPRITDQYSEAEGVDYHFVSDQQFMRHFEEGGFLECEPYSTKKYGTPIGETYSIAQSNKIALLKIEVKGAMQVMKDFPSVKAAFISPPSLETLRKHLIKRNDMAESEIERRLEIANKEIEKSTCYHYRIVNQEDHVDRTVEQLRAAFEETFPH